MRAQHPTRERENDAVREDTTVEVSDQITTDSTQEREREAETSTSTTDRWILTGVASAIGGLCRHTVATSTVCVTNGTRGTRGPAIVKVTKGTRGPATVMVTKGTRGTGDYDGDEGDQRDRRISLLIGTRGDQRDRRWLR